MNRIDKLFKCIEDEFNRLTAENEEHLRVIRSQCEEIARLNAIIGEREQEAPVAPPPPPRKIESTSDRRWSNSWPNGRTQVFRRLGLTHGARVYYRAIDRLCSLLMYPTPDDVVKASTAKRCDTLTDFIEKHPRISRFLVYLDDKVESILNQNEQDIRMPGDAFTYYLLKYAIIVGSESAIKLSEDLIYHRKNNDDRHNELVDLFIRLVCDKDNLTEILELPALRIDTMPSFYHVNERLENLMWSLAYHSKPLKGYIISKESLLKALDKP